MSERKAEPDLIERYFEGELDGPELEQFEHRLRQDEALREEVELQRRIDASLRRLFAAPAGIADGRHPTDDAAAGPSRRTGVSWYGLAAALLLGVLGVWGALRWADLGRSPLEREYLRTVAAGFEPEVVCTTDEEFARWMQEKFGHPMVVADPPADLELVGWSYSDAISGYTGLLLARVGGEPVVVVLDFLKLDTAVRPEPDADGLRVFRRTIGGLVLYEVTPHESPAIVDRLTEVERLPDEDA